MTNLKHLTLLNIDLRAFDPNTQVTTQVSLAPEMKTYYSDYLIDIAEPNLIHDQFAQMHPIPKNSGKTIEFRRFHPLGKALTPLTEGVTPDGNSLTVSAFTATIQQYGDYITLSDILELTAIDNNLVWGTKILGQQSGMTLDTVSREVMNGGTNVQYGENAVAARYLLVGGKESGNHYFTVKGTKLAAKTLKNNLAKKIDGSYVGIIHNDIAFDLTEDPRFEEYHKYARPEELFNGEIGRIGGVRFVETSEAKVFHAEELTAAARNLTFDSNAGQVITVDEAISADEATALIGRSVILGDYKYTIADAAAGAAGTATITTAEAIAGGPVDGDIIYPGEAGAEGRDVYSTLIMGADAYGTTEIEGGGLQHIVKQLGSAGTADPLNQRATVGWKATKVTEILVDAYMVRVETASTSEYGAN